MTASAVDALARFHERNSARLVKIFAICWCGLWFLLIFNLKVEIFRFALLIVIALYFCGTAARAAEAAGMSLGRAVRLELLKFKDYAPLLGTGLLWAIILAWCIHDGKQDRLLRFILSYTLFGLAAGRLLGWQALTLALKSTVYAILLSYLFWLAQSVWPALVYPKSLGAAYGRFSLYMAHPNYLGSYCGWWILLWAYCRLRGQAIFGKYADPAILALLTGTLLATGCRAGLYTMLIGVVVLLCIRFRHSKKTLAVIALVIAASVLTIRQLPLPEHQNVARLTRVLHNPLDKTIISRLPIWEVAVIGFKRHPFIGNGPHSYKELHAEYSDGLKSKHRVVEDDIANAHNVILGVLSDFGLIGLAAFLWICLACLIRSGRAGPPYSVGALAVFYYLLIGLVDNAAMEEWMNALFFCFTAFTYAGSFAGKPPTRY